MGANSKDEWPDESYAAIRCAKAAMLLLSLGSSQDQQEKEMMNQTIEELRIQLVKERFQRKNVKLCNLMELAIQISLLFSLCAFFLVLAFKSG